ncbi:tryptophan-rich sensory protein [Corynebacterium alimapuense]|uniref:tryptophan-rich sensory protein n=1 Tax=Corynebacterium alimapuense TaxID=1576874 RepID=UPI001FE577C1|nr:tryptophan-rich sensory protein [Corynebacterium alimapuense]
MTGSTGYVGGEVIQQLIEDGWAVRAFSRSRKKAKESSWARHIVDGVAGPGQVEVFEGDASDPDDLMVALEGIDVAWYLLHSMGTGADFQDLERSMAQGFADAAHSRSVARIIYLGGLHPAEEKLSKHLASRVEVGEILLNSGVPTAVLQAGVVLGDGSTSFAMLRHLSERLPGALGPNWISNQITPISVRDAVHYLVAAAELPTEQNRTFDIGGPDTMAYAEMLRCHARVLGLPRRLIITLPVVTPNTAAQWISLVTSVREKIAAPLIASLLTDTVVKERDLEKEVGTHPGGNQSFEEAILAATKHLDTRRWRRTLLKTAGAVTACAAFGTLLTNPQDSWFRSLDKPEWQPPASLFPIVWTALYADIAVISALVIADAEEKDLGSSMTFKRALAANLALNASWSALFFRSGRLNLAAAGAGILAVSSADVVRRAWNSSPQRGVVLAPYAMWTGFATVLSTSIAVLNRGRSKRR